jgi:coproporphyrinogen III oxidase-like Fe-S oxidoreductase
MKAMNSHYLAMGPMPSGQTHLPEPQAALQARGYMLYAHIPFCERLCPYCSFNRYPFNEPRARAYFAALRKEMQMLAQLGYDFASMYIGGGTPTILPDELCATIDHARRLFNIKEVSCETNPNHLLPQWLDALEGRVQRLSVGVQSFDNGLLAQMQRLDKYGTGMQILERLQATAGSGRFLSLNADMIFNFPSQTEDILINDLAYVLESGVNQTTFYPLMASPSVERQLAATVGQVNYNREARFYQIICQALTGTSTQTQQCHPERSGAATQSKDLRTCKNGDPSTALPAEAPLRMTQHSAAYPPFTFGSAWTFNATAAATQIPVIPGLTRDPAAHDATRNTGSRLGGRDDSSMYGVQPSTTTGMIDEYIVDYEEYPAIGAGGFSYLNGSLYVNTFSVDEYIKRINSGAMSAVGTKRFSKTDRMRYRLMMQLFGLRLNKQQWLQDFGVSVAQGLPAEYSFFKAAGAIVTDDPEFITLTPKGRYLLLALMREFFIGVNGLRDQARSTLPPAERELLFG